MRYNKNNESTNKYLAGLFDGDGTIYLRAASNNNYRLTMELVFDLSKPKVESTMLWLFDHYGFGRLDRKQSKNVTLGYWVIEGSACVSLFNTIKKHSVIKAIHGERIITLWYQLRNGRTTSLPALKRWMTWSRRHTSGFKVKNHFTWAWLAGYIDADGYIGFKQGVYTGLRFVANAYKDVAAIDLISRSTGRSYRYNNRDCTLRLDIHISKDTQGTAQKYLVKLLPHLRMKKWAAEQLLRYVKEAKKPNETWKKNFNHIVPAETK